MASTTPSGRIFENDLRKMVATLVWHNKYLGDKYDKESSYVDAVEVDTYLTGARHLLMTNTQADLERVENYDEERYKSFRIENAQSPLLPYWDMFYYGTKVSYPTNMTNTDELNAIVKGMHKYEEKNTYYRELYGLPEYNGTICHCNVCGHEENGMRICPICGSTDIDAYHSAPSQYSWVALFPEDYTKDVNMDVPYWVDNGTGGKIKNEKWNATSFLYNQSQKNRLYAEFTVSFIDDVMEKVGNDRHYRYLKHLNYAKIHPFVSRLSDRFELLYLADSTISFLNTDFRNIYEECRLFMKYRYYTEAMRNQYSQYEGFIGMAVLFMALQRMQSKYLEADITRDFYDLESIEVVYNAYSVPFYDEIPVTYHTKIIKAINKLISIKGTNDCFREIFAIFGYSTLNLFQYYILKTQKRDENGNPIFAYNTDGTEKAEWMYDVKIVKGDIGENPYKYILDSLNYLDYYGVTEPDTYWLNDDELLYKLYHSDYNFIETKYIGIEMAFSLTKFTIQTEYIMRMLLDNKNSGGNGTNKMYVYHGKLGQDIDLYTLVIYIMYLIGLQYNFVGGGSLTPLTDPAKLSAIYGFNFIEDFEEVFGYLSRKFVYNYKSGYVKSITTGIDVNTNKETPIDYFVATDMSDIDLYNVTAEQQEALTAEAQFNDLDSTGDNYAGFSDYIANYIAGGYIKRAPNDVIENKLVYAFNTIRKLLMSFTDAEAQMRNFLNVKFIKIYYSPDVCAYCGIEREMVHDQYGFCTNVMCYTNHLYTEGRGPLLKDKRGKTPQSMLVDTSKDTDTIKIRNTVYADFINHSSSINPTIKTLITAFNTIPYTEDLFREYLEYSILYDYTNTDTFLVDPSIVYDLDLIKNHAEVSFKHYTGEIFDTATIKSITVNDNNTPDVVIQIDKHLDLLDSDKISIKYRDAEMSYDDWCTMMNYGLELRGQYIAAKETYEYMVEHSEQFTPDEIYEAEVEMLEAQELYTHTLFYLVGVLSEFVDSNEDIDLSTYMWDDRSIQDILVDVGMYDALLGLRVKREFRLFMSNQIEELTDQVLALSAPYHDNIDDVRWIYLYLNYYFLGIKPDMIGGKSRLVDMIDKYFLFDHEQYISDYKYGGSNSIPAIASNTYMNESLPSVYKDFLTMDVNPETNQYITKVDNINVFTYINDYIRDILDADAAISAKSSINIGVGMGVDNNWAKLQSAYDGIVDMQKAFTVLTWGVKNPRTFQAVRRLKKMLMTTKYAKDVYSLNGSPGTVASTYGELLDSYNPLLTARADSLNESQRIVELEYSLSCLDKISDDLIYLHSYGGFNMKKIISYIFKLILFFKSAKADLLHYELEFHVDDKTDNLIKFMTDLTKLTTDSTISPDQWRFVDVMAKHGKIAVIDPKKTSVFTFTDAMTIEAAYKHVFSANVFGDEIVGHHTEVKTATDLNYKLIDYFIHDSTTHKVKDDMKIHDSLALGERVVYALDKSATPVPDTHGNMIYPDLIDENGNRVIKYHVNNM